MRTQSAIITTAVTLFIISCFISQQSVAFPLRNSRQSKDNNNFNFPDSTEVVDKRPTNSCFVHITNQYNEESTDGEVKQTNITSRRCCDGYSGKECNIVSDPYLAASPCSKETCPNYPQAICAVVSQCGEDIPVFLNDEGDIVDCGSTNENATNTPSQENSTTSCIGICSSNPCAGITCEKHPSAVCLTNGCSCQPIWLLETGVSVNCTTGDAITPERRRRRRRQISNDTGVSVTSSCSS